MLLLIICLVVCLFLAFLSHASKRHMRESISNISGPYCFPIIGAIHMVVTLNPKNLLQRGTLEQQKYGKIMRGWIFNRLIIITADAELNEKVLSSQQHIKKQGNYQMLRPWLGNGLLLSDGSKWHARRKIITPAFHFKILEQFVEVFDQQSNIFVERLAEKADGRTPVNIYPFVCSAALDIIAETAMGTKVHAQTDTDNAYAKAVNEMTRLMAFRFIRVPLNNEVIFSIFCPHLKWKQTQLTRVMHKFTTSVIEKRRRCLEEDTLNNQNTTQSAEVDDVGSKKRMALLDVLLQSTIEGKPLSNEDIREEVDTFMFEGHDTTTSAISFALHLIARHPKVQKKLFAEVQQVLGMDTEKPVTFRDLNELKYTECAIKEALRLYPSVPIIGRHLEEDFKYSHSKLGDGVLPANTELLISFYGMMNDADYFENPSAFIPERHEDSSNKSSFLLIPFSAGPRNCIGQKFAMLEMKIILAKLLRAYELLPLGPPVKLEMNIVLRSSNGYYLGLKKRDIST